MDVKGVNPFLFTEDEYTSPHSAVSNPFLLGDDYPTHETANDNPFLSEVSAPSNNTNPFAFDPMDLEPSQNEEPQFVDVTSNQENVFPTNPTQDFFTNQEDLLSNIPEVPPQKPTDLDLKYTNTVANGGSAPTRPPPPRPPPSKETQDLLMSVMGAMDATSSHLLDRIPPTRTPSPVNMRDLHSPSPTPEPTFGDLLDVGPTNKPQEISQEATQEVQEDLLSLQDNSCDINQNPPQEKPSRPKPPRPKPPPALVKPQNDPAPPPKPPAPKVQDEMLDMFGVENTPPPPKVATKADILNLYNAPPKQEKTATDLLFDSVEPEPKIQEPEPEILKAPEPVPEPMVQDNFISPEPSQNDLQMDTSDSQSKGSVSSVTFNPFAANEESANQPETTTLDNSVFLQNVDNQNDTFAPKPTQEEAFTTGKSQDEFDAFAQKFESVKDENKNGAVDAFSGDAWGNDFGTNQDTSTGFGAEESFDAFLALQEPPSVPQSTPNKVSKAASQESDEDKDFSVFIK